MSRRVKSFSAIVVLLLLILPLNVKSQWTQMSSGMGNNQVIYSFSRNGNTIFASTRDTGLFKTTNSGVNWTYISGVPSNFQIWSVYASGSNIFAGTNGDGIYRSTNNGVNWLQVNAGLTDFDPNAFIVKGAYVYAALYGTKIYRSDNNGTDWFPSNSGIPNFNYNCFAILGNNLYTAGFGGVYKSTNDGTNWSVVNGGLANNSVYDMQALGSDLYAATAGGVYRSTNQGTNWAIANQGVTGSPAALLVKGTNVIVGSTSGVFRSTNNGATWTVFNQGLATVNVYSLIDDGTYIYAGTYQGSIYRRLISELVSSITNISSEVPGSFTLSQNYPNPFNPVTNIQFSIPKAADVKIRIYDSQGREIAKLVDQKLSAGTYKTDFDGANLSSGVYYYKLESENFIQTKSMVLLK